MNSVWIFTPHISHLSGWDDPEMDSFLGELLKMMGTDFQVQKQEVHFSCKPIYTWLYQKNFVVYFLVEIYSFGAIIDHLLHEWHYQTSNISCTLVG